MTIHESNLEQLLVFKALHVDDPRVQSDSVKTLFLPGSHLLVLIIMMRMIMRMMMRIIVYMIFMIMTILIIMI